MKPSDLAIALRTCYRIRRPAFVWGPPGVGKSDMIQAVARDDKLEVVDFRMALRDPTDVKGFPMPDQATKTMKFFRDAELPTKGKGILFMDELNSAARATQAAGMQLCLDRKIGDYTLPEGWSIIAAGNRDTDMGVTNRMPSPLANRFTHYDYEVNADDWVQWAMNNNISAELIAFIRFRAVLLHAHDPKSAAHAFATPRSWVAADQLRQEEKNQTVAFHHVKGTVGDGPGAEYIAFIKMAAELPSVDEIKMNPDGAVVPQSPGAQWAIATALAVATTTSAFSKFMQYMVRMPTEYQATYVRDAIRKEPTIKKDVVFNKWAVKNEKVIT